MKPTRSQPSSRKLINEGHTTGVFSHHIDATTALSDELTERGIDHEIIGLPECLSAALDAQNAMVQFAGGTTSWKHVQQRLAVFVTSSVRGNKVPDLARMLLGQQTPPGALTQRLDALHADLQNDEPADAVVRATAAHAALGLPRGENHWQRAARLLRPLLTRHLRSAIDLTEALHNLNDAVIQYRTSLLTYAAGEPSPPVQLMGLYQTKGREADATVIVLRSNDFYGPERYEPFEVGSRLLYVILTRARHKTVVLLFGEDIRPLVAPLAIISTHSTP
jgi:ATP-dependent DNA helicase UvrD/PcrA